MIIAMAWSMRSTCARKKVGCLLADVDGYPIGSGFNGPAAGEPHCISSPCPGADLPSGMAFDECVALHAEWNAIARCSDVRRVYIAYVTHSPCITCTKILMNTGCRQIVFSTPHRHNERASSLWIHSNTERKWEHFKLPIVILTAEEAHAYAVR